MVRQTFPVYENTYKLPSDNFEQSYKGDKSVDSWIRRMLREA